MQNEKLRHEIEVLTGKLQLNEESSHLLETQSHRIEELNGKISRKDMEIVELRRVNLKMTAELEEKDIRIAEI